jgi:hypothetical protein
MRRLPRGGRSVVSTCVDSSLDHALEDGCAPAVTTTSEIFSVYVIELDEAVCHRTDCASRLSGKPHVYVGETSQTPEERFAQHLAGGFTSVPAVRNHGIRLRRRHYRDWGPYDTREASLDAEARLAKRLRRRGFCVRGGH